MVAIPKVIGVLSCGFLMCLSLSPAAQAQNAASAADEMKAERSVSETSDRRQGGQEAGEKPLSDEMKGDQTKGGKTIKGEVLRVEGEQYFVKGQDGKEIRLRTDNTTQMVGEIKPGDRIEAKVNEQNHALSIRSARGTEAGHEEGRDSLGELKK
jgi:hypothetical protein